MKSSLLAMIVVIGAVGAGCSSSSYDKQGVPINEAAGAEIAPPATNSVEPQARDVYQQPYWQPWQVPQ